MGNIHTNLTEDEFLRIYRCVKNKYGIALERRQEIIRGRLGNYLQWNGYSSYSEYMDAVESDHAGRLEREMINILTTNHTFFMREFEHFDFLRKKVLPELKRREEKRKDLCIWCGAASSGQEPYMLVMLLRDFFGWEADDWDTKVLATDVNTEVLAQAVRGVYSAENVTDLPESWKRRYLLPTADGDYEITREIQTQNACDIFAECDDLF